MRCNWVSFQLAPLIMYWTKERACMTFDREVNIPRFHHYNFKREAANPKSPTIGQHILIRRNIQNQRDIATLKVHSFSYEKIQGHNGPQLFSSQLGFLSFEPKGNRSPKSNIKETKSVAVIFETLFLRYYNNRINKMLSCWNEVNQLCLGVGILRNIMRSVMEANPT